MNGCEKDMEYEAALLGFAPCDMELLSFNLPASRAVAFALATVSPSSCGLPPLLSRKFFLDPFESFVGPVLELAFYNFFSFFLRPSPEKPGSSPS